MRGKLISVVSAGGGLVASTPPTYDAGKQPDGWVAIITDITARKKLEEALRESEHKLRQRAMNWRNSLSLQGDWSRSEKSQPRWPTNLITRSEFSWAFRKI
jgi:hypothetical protein